MPRTYQLPDSLSPEQKAYINDVCNKIDALITFSRKADKTRQTYKTYTRPFMAWCFTDCGMNPESAGPDEIRTFIDELQEERELSDRTVNHAIFEIKYLYLSVFGQSWNPYLVPTRKFDEFIAFVPTHEEVEKLLSSIDDPELLAAFCIMYGSGLRISEVCRLVFGDILATAGLIDVRPGTTKNRRERRTVLPGKVLEIIKRYAVSRFVRHGIPINRESLLFPSTTDLTKPVSPWTIGSRIRDYEARLGWEHRFTCHTFRRAFATHNYIDKNMTLEEISAALGHRDVDVTKIYLKRNCLWLQQGNHWNNAIDSMNI